MLMAAKLCILRCQNMSLRIRGRSSYVVFMGERVKWGGPLKRLCKNIFFKNHPLSFRVSTTTSISYFILLYLYIYIFVL